MIIKRIVLFVLDVFDQNLFRWIIKVVYPCYQRPRYGYMKHYRVLLDYFFMQKVMGFNRMGTMAC
jgi:hypothetical protein